MMIIIIIIIIIIIVIMETSYISTKFETTILYELTSTLITGRDTNDGYQGKRKMPKSSS